jgi:hypothetical protein
MSKHDDIYRYRAPDGYLHAWFDPQAVSRGCGTCIYLGVGGSEVEVTEVSRNGKQSAEHYLGMVVHHERGGMLRKGRPPRERGILT